MCSLIRMSLLDRKGPAWLGPLAMSEPPRPPRMTSLALPLAGDLLIVMAQVIVAVQMVLEEKFVYKHDVHPLRAVGTEGALEARCKGLRKNLAACKGLMPVRRDCGGRPAVLRTPFINIRAV